jgi:hypothetical protein
LIILGMTLYLTPKCRINKEMNASQREELRQLVLGMKWKDYKDLTEQANQKFKFKPPMPRSTIASWAKAVLEQYKEIQDDALRYTTRIEKLQATGILQADAVLGEKLLDKLDQLDLSNMPEPEVRRLLDSWAKISQAAVSKEQLAISRDRADLEKVRADLQKEKLELDRRRVELAEEVQRARLEERQRLRSESLFINKS